MFQMMGVDAEFETSGAQRSFTSGRTFASFDASTDGGALEGSGLRHLPILSVILLAEADAVFAKWAYRAFARHTRSA
jgi:hypothetical protein